MSVNHRFKRNYSLRFSRVIFYEADIGKHTGLNRILTGIPTVFTATIQAKFNSYLLVTSEVFKAVLNLAYNI